MQFKHCDDSQVVYEKPGIIATSRTLRQLNQSTQLEYKERKKR